MLATNNLGAMSVSTLGGAIAFVSNNSIFKNNGTSFYSLAICGVVTASNNVVADNTSSAASFAQVGCASPESSAGVTLNRNHFQSAQFQGSVASETGTTTGDPQWNYTGSIATPKVVSVLRNTGTNSPTGGLASTDFSGNARIIDGTVDRGAIEAATAVVGPTIAPLFPGDGEGIELPRGLLGATTTSPITFTATSGAGAGVTNLSCIDNSANVTLSASANQNIAVGAAVQPVVATFSYTNNQYQANITCTASSSGVPSYSFSYAYLVRAAALLGPALQAITPTPGSTTTLPGTQLNQVVNTNITFSAQGGATGGNTSLSCVPLQGAIMVSSGGDQTIFTGSTPDVVRVTMTISSQDQLAAVRCTIGRVGDPYMYVDFNFRTNAAIIFANGFEN